MKCPLLRIALITAIDRDVEAFDDCLKKECGFYSQEKNCCSIRVIAKELSLIQIYGINVRVAR